LTSVVIEPQAVLDIEEAARWYESQFTGLGVEFVFEADFAVNKVQKNPLLYAQTYRTVRRVLLRRFPYAMYFVVNGKEIRIIAVLHQVRSDEAVNLRLL
jgi:plasmid stabilization system protein ParE